MREILEGTAALIMGGFSAYWWHIGQGSASIFVITSSVYILVLRQNNPTKK